MTDFLPPVVMPEPPPPPPPVIEMSEDEEDEPTGFRDKIDTGNIFNETTDDPIVKPLEEDEELDRGCEDGMTFNSEMTGDEIPPCQREEKPKRKKKGASKKQLEALAKSRERLKVKREKARKEKQEVADEAKKIVQQRKTKPPPQPKISNDDIEDAIYNAISKYDETRKARKAKKKQLQAEEAKKNQLQNTISNAINGGFKPSVDPYAGCFNFH